MVWRARAEEAETVAGLLVEFRDWFGRDSPPNSSFLTGVERLMEDPATEYLLASAGEGGQPAGLCQLRFRYGVWHAAEDCWLEDPFVRDEARGRGLGLALCRAALDRARERRCARVELDVNEFNVTAVALYEGLGFSAISEGTGGRKLLMSLPL